MEPDISTLASLMGDKARAKMLTALMSGKALTATELATEADITAQTASSHLSKLLEGEMVQVRKQGRHKYFQLKSHSVAELIEQMFTITTTMTINTGPTDSDLKKSRVCYDHLAGQIGVALYDGLVRQGVLTDHGHDTLLTPKGALFFESLGADVNSLKKARRPLCKSCLDWSERRNHLAGNLGHWVMEDLISKQWAKQDLDSRVMRFSASGLKAFKKHYGLLD